MSRASAATIVMAVFITLANLYAWESPDYQVTVQGVNAIYTATPASSSVPGFKPHINFPWLTRRADGSLLAWWTVGQTHGVGNFGLACSSFDNGQTWTTPSSTVPFAPPITLMKPARDTSRGFSIDASGTTPFSTFMGGRYLSTDGGYTWTAGQSVYDCAGVSYISVYQNPGLVIQDGNTLMVNAFAQRADQNTFEVVLFASTDQGLNFTRRATIAAWTSDISRGPMGEEGPNESDVIMLDSGTLLAVLRTGQPFPNANIMSTSPSIFWTTSQDHGFTWTPAKSLGVMGAFPHLNRMPDGSVAMTYGRYGAQVMCLEPTGRRWSTPIVLLNESSSGYVRMHATDDGRLVYLHDHSSFYPPSWDGSPPAGYVYAADQMAHAKIVTLSIQRQAVSDDYRWMVEYHGDQLPNGLPVPWSLSQNGSVSAHLWAELGQDYLHMDTGTSGVNRSLYYTLTGRTGSPWAPLSFRKGVVLDVRARSASSQTTESAACVIMGDGANGYISLEITGSCVNLEGLNGNLGQVSYCMSGHPGFQTTKWHSYRLSVAPDAAAGGQARARLFLDQDYTTPILTQALNVGAQFDEIRFGDQTGNNNGAWDLDYLRVASLGPVYLGDYDGDDDVDAMDFGYLQKCLGSSAADADCSGAPLDSDMYVDQADAALFAGCLSGPGIVPTGTGCVR